MLQGFHIAQCPDGSAVIYEPDCSIPPVDFYSPDEAFKAILAADAEWLRFLASRAKPAPADPDDEPLAWDGY